MNREDELRVKERICGSEFISFMTGSFVTFAAVYKCWKGKPGSLVVFVPVVIMGLLDIYRNRRLKKLFCQEHIEIVWAFGFGFPMMIWAFWNCFRDKARFMALFFLYVAVQFAVIMLKCYRDEVKGE